MKRTLLACGLSIAFPAFAAAHPGHTPADAEFGLRHYLESPDHLATIVVVIGGLLAMMFFVGMVRRLHRRAALLK